jgi:hypothetical protein
MHWSQRRLCRKIVKSLSFPKMTVHSMPINMFFIAKIHWEPYFADNPRIYVPQWQVGPVIPPCTRFPFHCLLRLAGLWWRYSNLPPHGAAQQNSMTKWTVLWVFECLCHLCPKRSITYMYMACSPDSALEEFPFGLHLFNSPYTQILIYAKTLGQHHRDRMNRCWWDKSLIRSCSHIREHWMSESSNAQSPSWLFLYNLNMGHIKTPPTTVLLLYA